MKDRVVKQVIVKYSQRSEAGYKKYGTTLEDNPADFLEWLNHAQEEAMDLTLYLQKIKNKIEESMNEDNK
jgi:hypothetical protein